MTSITISEIRDLYLTAEIGNHRNFANFPKPCKHLIEGRIPEDAVVLEIILGWPEADKEQIMHCLSREYRHNEVYDCLHGTGQCTKDTVFCPCCKRWERGMVAVERITTGGIVRLPDIKYNNRHRITDLIKTDFAMGNPDTVPAFVFIGIQDDTPIEDDDVSQNIRLIDGAHRLITLARAGQTEFDVCVGYAE